MNVAQLEERIAQLEAKLADLESETRLVSGELRLCRAELHLRTGVVSTTFHAEMEATPDKIRHNTAAHNAKIARAMTAHKAHPFVAAVLADSRYGSITAWANAHKLPLATVASWYASGGRDKPKRKSARRPIPRLWAERIQVDFTDSVSKKSLVPATEVTWRNGIS